MRAGQLHHPQRGRGLVDGDEVGGVERAEEERLPALRAGLDRGRVEVVGPAVAAQARTGRAARSPRAGRAAPGRAHAGSVGRPRSSRAARPPAGRSPVPRRERTGPAADVAVTGRSRSAGSGRAGAGAAVRAAEDPAPVEQEPDHGGGQVGHDEHGHLGGPARPGGTACSAASAPEVSASPMPNAIRPRELVAGRVGPAADAEGQPPVDRRVGHRGEQQADRVRGLRRHHPAEQQIQQNVGQRCWPRRPR